ncbi:MAG TPA: HAD family phosphatase [Homoserinimonas sp.]|nr:HAD family phosphatase [Homoserinimonas sp.]
MTEPLLAGVLWDMDGTIVDTEPYWMRAEEELVASFGGVWTRDDALAVVGADLWVAARIFQNHGVTLSEDEIITRLTDRVLEQTSAEVPWRPGARQLLQELNEAGIPCALVTMSLHRMAQHVVSFMGFDAFSVVVGGDDVTKGKPNAEPYLRGAELLGVDPSQCIAIEDSTTGLASAVASGAVTIGVPAHITLPPSARYTLWPTLDGRGVSDLREHFTTARQNVA